MAETLADRIGPRRPCSEAERRAADYIADELTEAGIDARLESFRGTSTFAGALAVAPVLSLVGLRGLALALGAIESDLRLEPISRCLSRRCSQNVVAEVPSLGKERRVLALVSHLDSSRSGLLFHPGLTPHLRRVIAVVSAAVGMRALSPYLPGGVRRRFDTAAAAVLSVGLGLLAERELRGEDVPGANDNASGVAVATALVRELSSSPLEATRVVFLATGCEESGTVGMRAFLESRRDEWKDWIFLNLDGVGAPATLRYLPKEGVSRIYGADPACLQVFRSIARERPDLELAPAERLAGLTYDATQIHARGGRAITLIAQDRTIPNYHAPSDTPANLDRSVLASALESARLFVQAIDRGEADR